ncbi:hypothetical protein AWJ20_2378 [Sugiyamaella lignohabitans]|uniref:LYC1 C-terminal domain-containing protein n=1 Tax=Sugiyamaella lignohabitans TaxID=796027 RepID=A0A167F393_9ASCO|nr:uncharacterized protein AWJ20_2378 [Sugiyamaella lignohabitans]ANB14771.1 hypothetical protein AWJ20_2378 [Sugiyamaella lignohabitans]
MTNTNTSVTTPVSSSSLPTVDHSKYRLVELTDIKEIEQCHTRNYVEWAGGLTVDQYLQREKGVFAILAKYGFSLTYWALQEKSDSGDWITVSACESVCRPALYKVKGKPVNDTISHSIGSVFTPKENRGKGYAKIMMILLAERLHSWKTEGLSEEQINNSIIALWSDVGLFYGLFGYELTDAEEIKISPDYKSETVSGSAASIPEGVELLSSSEEIAKLVAQDEAYMVKRIDEQTEQDGSPRAIIAPRAGVFEHTFWRSRYIGRYLNKTDEKEPSVFGARVNGSWMLWNQDYGSKKLYGQRIFTDRSKYTSNEEIVRDIIKLIQAAVIETKKWNLPYLCIWTSDLPEGIDGDAIVSAYESTANPEPIVKWQRPGSLPMYHTSGTRKNLKWVFDGKYAWF